MRLIIYSLVFMIFCGCDVNTEGHPAFAQDGKLVHQYEHPQSSAPSSVQFYIEASGSMNGFFRRNQPTQFKSDVWAVVSDFPGVIDSLLLFQNMNADPSSININSFKNQMNTGELVSSLSTEVPTMIKKIITDLDSSKCEVAVLISDMKYSPSGVGGPKVLLQEYRTEIRNVFKDKKYSINLIGAKSTFYNAHDKIDTDESPYYFLVIGKQSGVSSVSDKVIKSLEHGKTFLGNMNFNSDYKTPNYSALPFKDVKNMINKFYSDAYYTFTYYSEDDGATFWVAMNIKHLPYQERKAETIKQMIQAKSAYGARIEVLDIQNKLDIGNLQDQRIAAKVDADLFIKIKVSQLPFSSDVVELIIKDKDVDQTWITPFFGAVKESDNSKSYSIEEFIKGLELGTTKYPYQKSPLYILISKKSI